MILASAQPVPPATAPDGSLVGWIIVAVVLALIVMGGLVLASRR